MAWREMLLSRVRWRGARLLLAQQAGVFQGDGRLVGEHAKDFEVAFVEHLLLPPLAQP